MSALINKIWYYTPNQYTTEFELTALFEDGQTSVYAFQKSGTSWEAVDGPHDGRLLITVPDSESNSFHVRAYTNDPFVSLSATYSNATSSATATDVMLKRIRFDKTYTDDHPYYKIFQPYVNSDIWNGFPENMSDIFLTNLTEYVVFPEPTINNNVSQSVDSRWYGWGLLNGTVSIRGSQMIGDNPNVRQMSVSTIITSNYKEHGRIPLKSTLPIDATDINAIMGERDILSAPVLGGVYKFLPLYNRGSTKNYILDSTPRNIRMLTVAAQNGEVTATGECQRVQSGWEVPNGGDVTLTATADEGYMFSTWSDGNTNAERTITNITENIDLTATFVAL